MTEKLVAVYLSPPDHAALKSRAKNAGRSLGRQGAYEILTNPMANGHAQKVVKAKPTTARRARKP